MSSHRRRTVLAVRTPTPWRQARQEHEASIDHWRTPASKICARVVHAGLKYDTTIEALTELGPFTEPTDDDLMDVAAEIVQSLLMAPTWSVAPDMVSLLQAASESMPTEVVLASDAPTASGFVWLGEPIWLEVDGGGTEVPFRAFQWYQKADAFVVITYRHRDEFARGENPEEITDAERLAMPRLWPSSANLWHIGHPNSNTFGSRFLKALWTISQQTIATTSSPVLPRQDRRRAERLQMPGDVVLVQLRRAKRPVHEDQAVQPVDWTHRWIVSGHWRNQYLPSSGTHRLQYIADHVKGPEDKPLVVKPRVFDVRR